MRADERRALGLRVRRARERRRLSQASLAHLAGCSERFVLELEAGRVDPRIGHVVELARVLGVSVVSLLTQSGVSGVAAGRTLEAEGDTRRREFLALLAAVAGAGWLDVERLESMTAGSAVDARLLDELEGAVLGLRQQWYEVGARALLPAAVGLLGSMRTLLPGPPRLTALTATTAILTGQLLQYCGRHGDAYVHKQLAVSLAREVGDDDQQALAYVLLAGQFSWRRGSDPRRALPLLERAVELTGPASPTLLRVVLLVTRAGELATIGDESGSLRDLEAAEHALRPATTAHCYGPRAPAEVAACRGTCELLLGRPRDAVATFDYVLAEMDPAAASWRATVTRDRDAALAQLS